MKDTPYGKFIDFMASHKLTVLALVGLMILTVYGTVDQKNLGIYQAQKKYFESVFVKLPLYSTATHNIYLPFLGGYSFMVILLVNLLVSFCVKFRFRWDKLGVWVIHIGLLLIFISSYITYYFSQDGHATMFEGEKLSSFTSYHTNEMLIQEKVSEQGKNWAIVPEDHLKAGTTFRNNKFGVQLKFKRYYTNVEASKRVLVSDPNSTQVIVFRPQPPEKESEKNQQGCIVDVLSLQGDKIGEFAVYLNHPVEFNYRGKNYTLTLRRVQTPMPFTIRLEKFIRETYAGTETPKRFESTITVMEEDHHRKVVISMNQPLRYKGHTLYQSAFAQTQDGEFQSTLAVVRNPAWLGPYIYCTVIFIGMIIHFMPKLRRFLRRKAVQAQELEKSA